jgi:hypothetical protein
MQMTRVVALSDTADLTEHNQSGHRGISRESSRDVALLRRILFW